MNFSSFLHEYDPDEVSPPGATLLDFVEERGISYDDLAACLEITTSALMDLFYGRIPLTSDLAVKLEKSLSIEAVFWNKREADYRYWLATKKNR
jgi:HTH-type transcriptional regulator/antitoxin HigA